jgi:hypothetical protein
MSDSDQMSLRCDLVEIRKFFELEGLGALQIATFRCPSISRHGHIPFAVLRSDQTPFVMHLH